MEKSAALSECAGMVRSGDRDRFLCAMFAPADRREALFALYAFNLEIARIRESVSEPLIGRMRLQWWRDAVASIFRGAGPNHPVALALAAAVSAHGLSRDHFETLIECREADMHDEPFETRAAVIDYAEGTSVPLVRLALEVLGVTEAHSHAAAQGAGKAWALVGLMRAVPFYQAKGRSYLPVDLCRTCGVPDGTMAVRSSPALCTLVEMMCTEAREAVQSARSERRAVSRRAVPALLPATVAESYLNMFAKAGHDPFDPRVRRLRPVGLLRLIAKGIRGSY